MTKKKNLYTKMLKDYPDVLNVYQMCKALGGISTKTGYKLLKEKKIESIKVGREYKIAKINLIDFITNSG
ncbi:MAG: helix-turn-helix domain-containing protein [Clostridia bacterium]|nr:helix-turn-helix domain-containing protein [Clostridia bacterium]